MAPKQGAIFLASPLSRQLTPSPMMLFAVRIEYAFDATIQRSHNPDARKHRWPVMVGNHSPAARLPNRQSPLSQATGRPARLTATRSRSIYTRSEIGLQFRVDFQQFGMQLRYPFLD